MNQNVRIEVDESPTGADIDRLRDGLKEHSTSFVDQPGFEPLAILARSADGSLVGGAYAFVNWNWIDISLLWVAETHRGQGLGSRLLLGLESAARDKGCRNAHLETFSYQARVFYERHGYKRFASLPDYPPGHERVYLQKPL